MLFRELLENAGIGSVAQMLKALLTIQQVINLSKFRY